MVYNFFLYPSDSQHNVYGGYEYNRVSMRTQQYIMERFRYVGKISRQGNKRMVIIPTEYHDKVRRIGDRQVHVDISLVYDDNFEDVESSKKSKK